MFSKIGKESIKLEINLTLHKLDMTVLNETEMSLKIQRGPHIDETKKFIVTKDKADVELDHKFQVQSTFYRDKAGKWLPKTIELFLFFHNSLVLHNSKKEPMKVGSVKIDMSSMACKGPQRKKFGFECKGPVNVANIECSFEIDLHASTTQRKGSE